LRALYGDPDGAGLSKLTTTVDGLNVTVRDAVPLMPERVALIVTGPPLARPVATPVVLTVANEGVLESQVTFELTLWAEPSE
jgi:hypothetical protein